MINISEDDARLFEQNGFTKEQVGATINHYREQGLSDDDIQARMNNKIAEFKSTPIEDSTQEQAPISGGISVDVTPSGLYKGSQNIVASAIAAPKIAKRDNISIKEAFNKNMDKVKEYRKNNPTPVQDFALDVLGYTGLSAIPGLEPVAAAKNASLATKIGTGLLNSAKLGAIPGALEGLKNGIGDVGKGALGGTALAGAVSGVPYVGKLLSKPINYVSKRGLEAITSLKPETIKQVIKPTSKALDLTENSAQNLLMDATEGIRADYNQLLADKGNQVGRLLADLPENQTFKAADVLQDYDKIYNNYSLSKNPALNPARNATTKELAKIEELLGGNMPDIAKAENQITPKELYDINKNISNMVDWDKPGAALKNDVLEQIYGVNAEKIASLSPELKEANKVYSDLMDFQKNEGIRRILNNSNNIDSASSALKNYNSTVTKGNTNRNIQDLEKTLVKNGYEPFLNKIDDINAAMDLLKNIETGRNFLGATTFAKNLIKPALLGVRKYNQSNLPALLQNIGGVVGDVSRRVVPATLIAPWQ